jgi:hypothetical protein
MLLADTGYEVLWYSPDSSDTAWLMATVADDSGAVKIESTRVIVMPDTTMFVWWWDGAVKAGDYVSWADTARAGATLAGSATTRADTLDTAYLTIMDEENFQRWVRHEPAQVLLRRVAHEADTFSVRMPATSRYRVVIDNTESALDYNYWIYVLRISP